MLPKASRRTESSEGSTDSIDTIWIGLAVSVSAKCPRHLDRYCRNEPTPVNEQERLSGVRHVYLLESSVAWLNLVKRQVILSITRLH